MDTLRDVVAVTVTYGNRAHLAVRVIDAVLSQGAERVVVVLNGASVNSVKTLKNRFGGDTRVQWVDLGSNLGASRGFAAGIRKAAALAKTQGYRYVLLLDDDTVPAPGTLEALVYAADALAWSVAPRVPAAVVACRNGDFYGFVKEHRVVHDAFCGFHVRSLPRKIARCLAPRRRASAVCAAPMHTRKRGGKEQNAAAQVKKALRTGRGIERVDFAPFAGLMLPVPVIDAIGLPSPWFCSYEADTEYTWRITRRGGIIYAVEAAVVVDLEPKRSEVAGRISLPQRIARAVAQGDSLTLEGLRAHAALEKSYWVRNWFTWTVNRVVVALAVLAAARNLEVARAAWTLPCTVPCTIPEVEKGVD